MDRGTIPRGSSPSGFGQASFGATHHGGRGVYFPDPDGHYLEVITRPYGSGAR
jgi:hypothetical protein